MNRRLCRRGFIAASLVGGVLGLPWTAAAGAPGIEGTDPLGSLKRYANIRSIHLLAHAAFGLAAHDDQPAGRGTGEFEFWAEADRYRVRCVTSPALGLASDRDIAFDGSRVQSFDRESGLLTIKKGADAQMTVALPNPLFLPLEFLNPGADPCPFCATRLVDLQDPGFWSRRTKAARPFDSARAVDSLTSDGKGLPKGLQQYDVDGAVLLGARLSYRVVLGSVLGRIVPLRITRFSSDGSRVEINASHFEVTGSSTGSEIGPIPLRIDMAAFDETGKNVSNVTFTIDVIELNWKVDGKVFTIDESQAKVVWDGDEHVFTKHYDPAIVNRKFPDPN